MKPVRGSNRAPSKAPNAKDKRKTGEGKKPRGQAQRDKALCDKDTHLKVAQKRKAAGPASVSKKAKGQENWKPISRSTINALENAIDLSILATLTLRRTERKEAQEHLNMLKSRFLAECAKIRVQKQRPTDLVCSQKCQQEESKKSLAGNKTLSALKEDLMAVVHALEKAEAKTASLEQKCNALRDQVEEEEDKAKAILQLPKQCVLNLPSNRPQKDDVALETQMREMIPAQATEETARKLGRILHTSAGIQDFQVLLRHAHKHADEMHMPGSRPISGQPCSGRVAAGI